MTVERLPDVAVAPAGTQRRIGYFPITGDPIHLGHIQGALDCRAALSLETVYIQVCGDVAGYKPTKLAREHRHAMAQLAIQPYEPEVRYTPIGFDNGLVGEDNFVDFMERTHAGEPVKFFYIAGVDNERIVRERLTKNRARIRRPYETLMLGRFGIGDSVHGMVVAPGFDYSSSSFRRGERPDIVPAAVFAYCRSHGLYSY